MEILTSNQALDLLTCSTELSLTKVETAYLKLTVILDWEELSPCRKESLVSVDKLEILSIMSHNKPVFH